MDQLLSALGGEDIEASLEAAMRMQRAGEKATELRADLEQSHPNLDTLMDRLAELDDVDGGQAADDTLAEAKIRVEELSDQIEALGWAGPGPPEHV